MTPTKIRLNFQTIYIESHDAVLKKCIGCNETIYSNGFIMAIKVNDRKEHPIKNIYYCTPCKTLIENK